jgi:hypothetical protein
MPRELVNVNVSTLRMDWADSNAAELGTQHWLMLPRSCGIARIAHRRPEQVETAGFQYHAALDTWECPTDEQQVLVGVRHDDPPGGTLPRASRGLQPMSIKM